ncbi:DUF4382 domain-containing protein [Candidatus Micrarchaeota archaeon]|nr:DUF4382 domain-containing protein [Candidatus Micrarchaeota archaeon]
MNSMRWMLLGVLAVSLMLVGCTAQGSVSTTPTASPTSSGGYGSGTTATGRAVFGVTDAAADMGAVSSVQMRIDSVQVHSASQGWVTASSESKTVDLLELKAQGATALLADAQLKADTYDQMRMDVSSVTVVDAEGSHQAKMPSNQIKFIGDLVVKANGTSSATFDFIADESLHVAGKAEGQGSAEAKYVMAPVIQFESRTDAKVNVENGNRVQIVGGSVKTNVKVGMDIKGNVGIGLAIPADAVVLVGTTGDVIIGGTLNSTGNIVGGIGVGGSSEASGSASADASGSASGGASGSGSGSVGGAVSGVVGGGYG